MSVCRYELGIEPPTPHPGNSNTVHNAQIGCYGLMAMDWEGDPGKELRCRL